MQVFIKGIDSQNITFDCNENTTLYELKKFVFKKKKIPSTCQYFVVDGRNISHDEYKTFKELNITKEATIHLLLKWHGIGCICNPCMNKPMLLRNGKRLLKN